MPPNPKDAGRLWDMLDAAQTVAEFTSELRFEDFVRDRKTRDAVERNLEIIGEAARCVSPATRESHTDIPWRLIIGLRNMLAHEYGEIRYETLWKTIHDKIPLLVEQLKAMGVNDPML